MRPLLAKQHQQHSHSTLHSNSVGTLDSQQHHQYLFSNNNNNSSNNGLSNKPIGKASSFGGIANQPKSNSPNTSSDNMTPLLLKNRMTAPKAIDKEISKWSCQDVGIWLDWMKLSHLKQIFIQNQISGDELLELTDAEIINDLKVRDETERKLIKELIENREVWMKQGSKKLSNDSLDSLDEYQKPISPIGMTPQIMKFSNQKNTLPNTKSSLELDEFSDCDDLTSVGGIFLDRATIGSQKLEVLLESLYKDVGNVKFKVYRGSDIYLITQKRSLLSFTSLKLEIIERYQCVKPIILYKTRDGDFIKINRDEDLARVISSYHQNGGDISQPIKLQIETNDLPVGLISSTGVNSNSVSSQQQSSSNNNQNLQSPREWTYSSDQSQSSTNSLPPNNQLAQKLIELELDNIEKNNSIRELEIRLHNQQVEHEKQSIYTKSLQDDTSTLKMQLYSYKNGTVFNPSGSLTKQEEITEYIKLCKSLQASLSTAQNKLFELIGNQL